MLAEYRLSGADLAVLKSAVVLEDLCDQLMPMVRLGPMIKGPDGVPVVNPACREYRLSADARTKQLAGIRVIGDESSGEAGARLQHRAGFRGSYSGLKAVE